MSIKIDLDFLSESIEQAKVDCLNSLPEFMRGTVKEKGYLAGGCFSSLATSETPKDYDIFLREVDESFTFDLACFMQEVLDNDSVDIFNTDSQKLISNIKIVKTNNNQFHNGGVVSFEGVTNRITSMSKRAITFKKSQVIIGFLGDPEDVIDEFDLCHTMVYSDFSNKKINFLRDSKRSIENKEVRINKIEQVLAVAFRVHKMMTRGWEVSDKTLRMIEECIRTTDISTRRAFLSHVSGAYA